MNFNDAVARVEGLFPQRMKQAGWMRPRFPMLGVEVRADAVLAVHLTRKAKTYHVVGHGRVPLAEGVFETSVMKTEIGDADALKNALTEVLQAAGAEKAHRISLAIPDTAARVFIVDLAEVPRSPSQLEELIRWRVKKSLPFAPEEAALCCQVLGRTESDKSAVLVSVAPWSTIRPIEALFESAGYRLGLIDLASFNVYNALRLEQALEGEAGRADAMPARVVRASSSGIEATSLEAGSTSAAQGPPLGRDRAIVSATPEYFTIMILRGEQPVFYRAKNYHVRGGYQGEASLRVVGRELLSTLSYYEEHLLGDGIGRTLVRAVGMDPSEIMEVVRDSRLGDSGLGVVREAGLERILPEMPGLDDALVMELLPAAGLALRREP